MSPQDTPDPFVVALALLPLGWAALDLLLTVARRRGGGVHAQEWTQELNAVGWWVCQLLAAQEAPDGC